MEHDFTSGTPNSVSVGATSTTILAAKSERSWAVITNDSNEKMYLSCGAAAVQGKGIPLLPGEKFEINGLRLFRGAVYGICASGSKTACYFEA